MGGSPARLYDHQPPSPLSPIEPTLADRFATTAPSASIRCKACVTITGPIALIWCTRAITSASTAASDFSGAPSSCRTPATFISSDTREPPVQLETDDARLFTEVGSVTSQMTVCSRSPLAAARAASPLLAAGSRAAPTTMPPASRVRCRISRHSARPIPREAPVTTCTGRMAASGEAPAR